MRDLTLKAAALFAYFLLSSTPALHAQATYEEHKDDFTGEDKSYVLIMPVLGDSFGLAWKCENDGLNIILAHKHLAGDSDDDVIVLYKFDDSPPSQKKWYRLYDSNKITYFDMRDVSDFTEKALKSNSLMVRIVDPADQEVLTGTFIPTGLSEQLSKIPCR